MVPPTIILQLIMDLTEKLIVIHSRHYSCLLGFIRNIKVSYYILSTDGKKHGHPSKQVIANILYRAPGEPKLLKNFDISDLKDIGVIMGDEH